MKIVGRQVTGQEAIAVQQSGSGNASGAAARNLEDCWLFAVPAVKGIAGPAFPEHGRCLE